MDWFDEAYSRQVLPSSCPFSWILLHFCSVASIAAGPQGKDQTAWELVVVAGGHQWCLSQRTGTNTQTFSLSMLWPSALPAQDFQLALRFSAIFGLPRGCYQMSLPLESCCKGRSYLICHCCPPRRWNVLPRQPRRWDAQRGLPRESLCRLMDTSAGPLCLSWLSLTLPVPFSGKRLILGR